MSVLKLYDTRAEKYIDALYALLVTTASTEFFPEMYEIFGRNAVVKFLDIFAGQTIRVPSREVVEEHIRDATVWVEVQRGERTLPQIAESHGIVMKDIDRICEKVQTALRKLGITVVQR